VAAFAKCRFEVCQQRGPSGLELRTRPITNYERQVDMHPTRTRTVVKTVSWRAIATIDTFIISYLVTGSFTWAGSIASFEVMTKIFIYYLHERAWIRVKWGL
jgi:uncharacterized membrane protein